MSSSTSPSRPSPSPRQRPGQGSPSPGGGPAPSTSTVSRVASSTLSSPSSSSSPSAIPTHHGDHPVATLDQSAIADAAQASLLVTHFDSRNCTASADPKGELLAVGFNLTLSLSSQPVSAFNVTPWLVSWTYPSTPPTRRSPFLRRSWTTGNQSFSPVERSVSLPPSAGGSGAVVDVFTVSVLRFTDAWAGHWVMSEMVLPCASGQATDVMAHLPSSVILWSVNGTNSMDSVTTMANPPVALFSFPSSPSSTASKHQAAVQLAAQPPPLEPEIQKLDNLLVQTNTDPRDSGGGTDNQPESRAATAAFIAMLVMGGAVLVTVVTVVVCWCRANRKHARELKQRRQQHPNASSSTASKSGPTAARPSSIMVYSPPPHQPHTTSPPPPRPARSTGTSAGGHSSSSVHSYGQQHRMYYQDHPYAQSAGLSAGAPRPPPQVSFANHAPPGLPSPTDTHPPPPPPQLSVPAPTAASLRRPDISISTPAADPAVVLRKRDSTTQTGTPPPVHVVVHRDAATSPLDLNHPPPRITILTPSPSVLSSLGSDPSLGEASTVAVVGRHRPADQADPPPPPPPMPPVPSVPVEPARQDARGRQSEVERMQEKALFDQLSDLLRLHEEQQAARKARSVGVGGSPDAAEPVHAATQAAAAVPERTHESMRPMPGYPQQQQPPVRRMEQGQQQQPARSTRDPYHGFPPSRQRQQYHIHQPAPTASFNNGPPPRRPQHESQHPGVQGQPPATQFPTRADSHHHPHHPHHPPPPPSGGPASRTTPPPTRNHSRPATHGHAPGGSGGRRRSSSFGSARSSTPRNSLSLDRLLKSSADASGSYYDAVLHDLRTALPPTPPPPTASTGIPAPTPPHPTATSGMGEGQQGTTPIPPPPMDGPVPNVSAPSSPIVPRFFVAPPRPPAGEGEAAGKPGRKKPPSLVIPTIYVSPPSTSTPSVDYPPYFDDDEEEGEGEEGEGQYDEEDEEDEEEYYRRHGAGYMDEDDDDGEEQFGGYYGHWHPPAPTPAAIVDSDLTSDEDPAMLMHHYPSGHAATAEIEVISPTSSMDDDDDGPPPPPPPQQFPAAAKFSSALVGAAGGSTSRRPSGSGPMLTYGSSTSGAPVAYATPVVPVVSEKHVPAAASAVVWSSSANSAAAATGSAGAHMYHAHGQQQPSVPTSATSSGAPPSPAPVSSSAGSFSISKMYPSSSGATDISDTEDEDDFVLHMSTPPPAAAGPGASRTNPHAWQHQQQRMFGANAELAGQQQSQQQPLVTTSAAYKQSPPHPVAHQAPAASTPPQRQQQQQPQPSATRSTYKQSPPHQVVYQSPAASSPPGQQQGQPQPQQPGMYHQQHQSQPARRAPPPSPINTTWTPADSTSRQPPTQFVRPAVDSAELLTRSVAGSQPMPARNDPPPPRRTAIPTSAAMAPLVQHFGHQISTAAHAQHQYRTATAATGTPASSGAREPARVAQPSLATRPPPLSLQQPTAPSSVDQPPILSPRPRRSFPDLARRVELAAMAAQQEHAQAQQQQASSGYVPAPQYVNPNRGKLQQPGRREDEDDKVDPFSAPGAVVWSTNAGYVASGQR